MSIWNKGVLGALKLSGLTAGRSSSGCRSGESFMGQGQVSFLRACCILSPVQMRPGRRMACEGDYE